MILKQFVDEYGLTVGSEYQSTLNSMVAEGRFAAEELEDIHTKIATYCYEQMPYSIEVIDDGLLSVRVGTPEFQQAVRFVIPDSTYDKAQNGDEKITLIHDYLDGHEYMSRYFTVSDDGDISIELVNIIEFVHDCQATGLFYGEDESNFGLTEEAKSIYSFSQTFDITASVAIAMLYAIDTVSYNWDESIACEVLALPGHADFLSP